MTTSFYAIILIQRRNPTMKKNIKELREKYISNPPEGMSEDDLLDMDCFLNEDVFGDDFGDEGFYIF